MLVNAERRFAARIAKWLNDSTLDAGEMTQRINKFPDTFIKIIVEEHNKLVAQKKKPPP